MAAGSVAAGAVPDLKVRDSVVLLRFLLGAATAGGADAVRLARESQLPAWALSADLGMLPSRHALRLWELAEHTMGVRHAPLAIASEYRPGSLDLFDYLFTTAATLRDGMQTTQDFLHLVTCNGRIGVTVNESGDTSYTYQHSEGKGSRGSELGTQFAMFVLCDRARAASGRLIVPASVEFAQSAPRSYQEFTDVLGTSRIEFDAPVTAVTFRAGDLDLPLRGADSKLARILHRHASSLPLPPPVTWREHVQQVLGDLIEDGTPSLDAMARRLVVSTRTLQRQLAEHGTTWRAELDTARRRRAMRARQAGSTELALARQLGYADPGSARRALRRWNGGASAQESGPRKPQPLAVHLVVACLAG